VEIAIVEPGGQAFRFVVLGGSVALLALAALAVKAVRRWLGLGFAVGYAKLRTEGLAANATRRALVAAIHDSPGIGLAELATRVAGDRSTVVYHLRTLERHGAVSSIRHGRHRRYFVARHPGNGERERAAVLGNPRTRQAYTEIRSRPGIDRAALAVRLGITIQGTAWHLGRLKAVGLIEASSRGRRLAYFLRGAAAPPAWAREPAGGLAGPVAADTTHA
jgi:predicted transcriptional regulator